MIIGFLESIHREHADQRFILHNENDLRLPDAPSVGCNGE